MKRPSVATVERPTGGAKGQAPGAGDPLRGCRVFLPRYYFYSSRTHRARGRPPDGTGGRDREPGAGSCDAGTDTGKACTQAPILSRRDCSSSCIYGGFFFGSTITCRDYRRKQNSSAGETDDAEASSFSSPRIPSISLPPLESHAQWSAVARRPESPASHRRKRGHVRRIDAHAGNPPRPRIRQGPETVCWGRGSVLQRLPRRQAQVRRFRLGCARRAEKGKVDEGPHRDAGSGGE